MRIKGRRQTENILDLRDPKDLGKFNAKQDIRDMKEFGELDEIGRYDALLGMDIANEVRAAQMLLGSRWKD